ncbi:MAG: hypothetical protein ACI9J3_000562 [Parvicellaceae bacterium]|jgi:hypothetical protein
MVIPITPKVRAKNADMITIRKAIFALTFFG